MSQAGGSDLNAALQAWEATPGPASLAAVAASLTGPLAEEALEALARLACEEGEFALAVAAAKALPPAAGQPHLKRIADTYARGSGRLDTLRPRTRPPAPPRPATRPPASGSDGLESRAREVVAAALARAEERAGEGRKLPAAPVASELDRGALAELIAGMSLVQRRPGDVVVEEGAEARSLFLVARGSLEVTRGKQALGRLRAGALFGEIALLSGTRRTARVTCAEDTWLLEIDAPRLEAAAARAPALADTLAAFARQRLLANTMRTSEIFRRLPQEERETLVRRFESRVWEAGAAIVKQGQEARRLHVVVSGNLRVEQDRRPIAELRAGDVFGEASLLGRKAANADVIATSGAVTLSLDGESFDQVAMKHPELLAEVYKLVVARDARNATAPAVLEVDADDLVV